MAPQSRGCKLVSACSHTKEGAALQVVVVLDLRCSIAFVSLLAFIASLKCFASPDLWQVCVRGPCCCFCAKAVVLMIC